MTPDWVALGVSLNSLGWIAAWHRGAARGRSPSNRTAAWRAVALVGALVQLAAAAALLGWLEGAAVVAGAWMILGLGFAVSVNASPVRSVRGAAMLGLVGGLVALGSALVV
jgi:hypothetical protein